MVREKSELCKALEYPLTVLDRPIESETSKIVENSYRATTLAFLNEWSLFAERNGMDLIKREIGGHDAASCPPISRPPRRLLPGGRGGYPLQRLGDRGEKAHGNGGGNRHPRPLREAQPSTLKGVDAVVLAVRHEAYMTLDPDEVIKMIGRPVAVIDCFGILNDEKIKRYF